MVADVVLAFASTLPVAALALVQNGVGVGLSWRAWQSLVASVIPRHLRQRYFGLTFTLLNLGIGIGGSFLPALLLLLGPLRHVARRPARHTDEHGARIGHLAVLQHAGVRRPASGVAVSRC